MERNSTMTRQMRNFLLPSITKRFLLRLMLVAALAFIVFRFLLLPVWIEGSSMEPTCQDGGFTFCLRLRYLFRPPAVGDIVMVRFSGPRVMLLKRVVATAGDVVEFRNGYLYVNNQRQPEEYVVYRADWNLPPRRVKPGHVYVVGDNRGMDQTLHIFGQTPTERIVGVPIW